MLLIVQYSYCEAPVMSIVTESLLTMSHAGVFSLQFKPFAAFWELVLALKEAPKALLTLLFIL
jgi:hypothetical protein